MSRCMANMAHMRSELYRSILYSKRNKHLQCLRSQHFCISCVFFICDVFVLYVFVMVSFDEQTFVRAASPFTGARELWR